MDRLKKNKTIFISVIIFLLIPVVLNIVFIHGAFSSGKDLGNKEWLGFWGSYLGGTATLLAVWLTLRQNKKIIIQNEQILFYNKKGLEFQEEKARLSILPYIDVNIFNNEDIHKLNLQQPSGFIILKRPKESLITNKLSDEYRGILENPLEEIHSDGVITTMVIDVCLINLVLTQKSPSLARNIYLTIEDSNSNTEPLTLTPLFVLSEGEKLQLPILFDRGFPKERYEFTLNFEDIEGRLYKQKFYIHYKRAGNYSFEVVSPPKYYSP
ncbi:MULTISPECIES: hypothetical protein [unclassified Exiguobacterium]|uniref:hypothetical protein n=1 Tax=unclassified Exiguobacterium TaxID=2644629 RepID=UPI001BEA3CE6|nr:MULTISPECIES: hypothetical protein [unclassified Exiguobacterium]